jgi:RNA 2',3'-cyclic 3'-phosphodiesterase
MKGERDVADAGCCRHAVGVQAESEALRLFVAIRLPDAVKAELIRAQSELRGVLPARSTAWTKPDNMHLTLRFLGRVASERLPGLKQSLRVALPGFGSLDLHCERLGCFPDLLNPRVVWAWVHDAADGLAKLHRAVNEAADAFAGKPAEKRFEGHVTIARTKSVNRPDAERLASFVPGAVERRFGAWRCDEVELVRSELLPQGSRYTILATLPLTRRQPRMNTN